MLDALEFDGPAIVCCYTTCQPEHGVADNMATDQARLAVDTRAFPLLIYDPRKGDTIRERLSLQGNPAMNEDWWTNPKTGEQVDFIDFARSEGRFAQALRQGRQSEPDAAATPSRTGSRTGMCCKSWRACWRVEIGGEAGGAKAVAAPKPAAEKSAAAKAAAAKARHGCQSETTNGSAATGGADPEVKVDFKIGMKIKYHDGAVWVPGVVESIEPAVLALEDDTEIRTSLAVLEAGAAEGLIVGLV